MPVSYITNKEGKRTIYFRKQLLPFILVILSLGLIVIIQIKELSLAVDQIASYQKNQEQITAQIIRIYRNQKQRAQQELIVKNDELAAKIKELAEVSRELEAQESLLAAKQKEITSLQAQIKNQQSQLASNAAELERLRARPPLFSFQNESSQADISDKESQVKEVVTSAYDYIIAIYGQPYLLHSVTITFVDTVSVEEAAAEIRIANSQEGLKVDIRLRKFDKTDFNDVNAIIHEIIHSFHGLAVFDSAAFEEGITVAATDAVIQNMIRDKKLPDFGHLYITISDSIYQRYNRTLNIPHDSESFYQSADVSKYYQMVGWAWWQLYEEDSNFFKNFNERYYKHIQVGKNGTDNLVEMLIKEVVSTVNGQAVADYLAGQKAFNLQN